MEAGKKGAGEDRRNSTQTGNGLISATQQMSQVSPIASLVFLLHNHHHLWQYGKQATPAHRHITANLIHQVLDEVYQVYHAFDQAKGHIAN